MVQLSHLYMTNGKTIVWTIWTFVGKVISLLFKMLSWFVTAFVPGSKCLNFKAAVTIHSDLGDQENKTHCCFHFSSFICHEVMEASVMILVFECWVLSQPFHSPLSTSSRGSLVPLYVLPYGRCYLHIWGYCYFPQQSWFQLVLHPAQHFMWYTLQRVWRDWVTKHTHTHIICI